MYSDDCRYLDSHQWVKVEGEIGTVGITKHGQEELVEIVYIELPPKGKKVKQKEPFCNLESIKTAFDVPSPVSGEIIEVNEKLGEDPAPINNDPHGEGWLVKIKISDMSEVESLLSASDYEKIIKKD